MVGKKMTMVIMGTNSVSCYNNYLTPVKPHLKIQVMRLQP